MIEHPVLALHVDTLRSYWRSLLAVNSLSLMVALVAEAVALGEVKNLILRRSLRRWRG
jgi:hypothetical protein